MKTRQFTLSQESEGVHCTSVHLIKVSLIFPLDLTKTCVLKTTNITIFLNMLVFTCSILFLPIVLYTSKSVYISTQLSIDCLQMIGLQTPTESAHPPVPMSYRTGRLVCLMVIGNTASWSSNWKNAEYRKVIKFAVGNSGLK